MQGVEPTPTGGTCPNDFSDPIDQEKKERKKEIDQEKKEAHLVCSELENSDIRVAVGDCSVIERRRWRMPYQTGKTVHVHTNILQR